MPEMFEKPWKKDSDEKEESLSKIYVLAHKHITQLWLIFQDRHLAKCREVLRQHRNLDINVLYSHSMFGVVFGRAWELVLVND